MKEVTENSTYTWGLQVSSFNNNTAQKINRETEDLNNTIKSQDVPDFYITAAEYIFLSA